MRSLLLAIAVAVAPGSQSSPPPSPRPEPNPLVGNWVANLEKSRRHANHQFKSATMEFAVAGDTVTLTHGGVNAGGQEESGTTTVTADGKEHAVPGQAGVVVVAKWRSARALEISAGNAGAPLGASTYEVSTDGKTLTATVSGIDAGGRKFEQVIVFDRK